MAKMHFFPWGNNIIYHHQKITTKGGGVALLIKNSILNTRIFGLDENLEIIGVKIEAGNFSFNLVTYYEPKGDSLSAEAIESYMRLGPNLILVGDLNSKALSVGCRVVNRNGILLEEILSNTDLIVINDKFSPTYFSYGGKNYSEILDLILCTGLMYKYASNFEVLSDYIMGSDHAPIVCNFSFNFNFKSISNSNELRYNFKKADWNQYREIVNRGISELDSKELWNLEINSLNAQLSDLMVRAAESSIPKFLNYNAKSYPEEIISLIKNRREIRRDIKKIIDLDAKKIFRTEYNRLTRELNQSIKSYTEKSWLRFLGKLGPYPPSTREFWAKINQAKNQKKSGNIPNLLSGSDVYKSDEEKANLFATILSETFTDDCTSTEFDIQFHSYVENYVKNFDYTDDEFTKVSLDELRGIIKTLKVGSSPGEDNIHNIFIKQLPTKAVEKLLELVNISIVEGLPDAWKIASITMIPKKESFSNSPADYRPISLTSCVGKLTERVVKERLYKYLEEKNLIVPQQSGFRNKRGTADNLVSMTQKIKECLIRKKKACGIYFDISKAFDKVWQAGLIYKMLTLGIPVYLVRFVKYFLEKRKFRVVIKLIKSIILDIFCGVPQGSVLGPLLFLVFIGDIPLSNSVNVSFSALFADDLGALFFFKKPGNKLKTRIRNYIQSLVDWLFKWRLKMNATKCCYTIFSNSGRGGITFDIKLNNEYIPYNSNPIFLGITFDERLCFTTHFANLRVRALRRLNIIKIFSHKSWHLNKKTLITVYRALIGSIFDYSFFTISNCSETALESIQRVQNRAIRCIYRLPWDSPTDRLFDISGVLFLKQRFTQLGSRYLLKALYFKNKFIITQVSEYFRAYSVLNSKKLQIQEMSKRKTLIVCTPLCTFCTMVALSYGCLVLNAMNILSFRKIAFCFLVYIKKKRKIFQFLNLYRKFKLKLN